MCALAASGEAATERRRRWGRVVTDRLQIKNDHPIHLKRNGGWGGGRNKNTPGRKGGEGATEGDGVEKEQ